MEKTQQELNDMTIDELKAWYKSSSQEERISQNEKIGTAMDTHSAMGAVAELRNAVKRLFKILFPFDRK